MQMEMEMEMQDSCVIKIFEWDVIFFSQRSFDIQQWLVLSEVGGWW